MTRRGFGRRRFFGSPVKLKASGVPVENEVKKACLSALRKFGFEAWVNYNGGVYDRKRSAQEGRTLYRRNPNALPGVADIIAIRRAAPSRGITYFGTLYVETKAEDGVQSDEQKAFQAIVEAAGELYILADTVEGMIEKLQEGGAL